MDFIYNVVSNFLCLVYKLEGVVVMSWFIATLILLGIELIILITLFIVSIKVDKDKKKWSFLSLLFDLIMIIVTYTCMSIPSPEIYPSNGQISEDGNVKIYAEKRLGIYYTLNAYSDPKDDGIKYKNKLKLDKSATINVKTHFLGKWSECVTLDLVLGNDGSINGNKTKEPGTSVESITASCTEDSLHAGLHLKSEDIKVEGKTINGDIVPIEDFVLTPNNVLKEGKNIFTISYENLKTNLEIKVKKPQLISIEAEFSEDKINEGEKYTNSQFTVIGKYEDGSENQISDFTIFPDMVEQSGKNIVTIVKDGIEAEVEVEALPEGFVPLSLATLVREENLQGYMVNSDFKTLQGEGYSNGYIAKSAGVTYDEIISVCSYEPFELIYNLEDKYNSLSGKISFDDMSRSQDDLFGIASEFQGEAQIIFSIDDKEKDIITLKTTDFPKPFSINVSGAKKLSIRFSFPYYNFVTDNFTKYFNIIDTYLENKL